MSRSNRTQLGLGIVLVLLGIWFLVQRTIPQVAAFAERFSDWPFTVIGAGALLLLLGLILGAPGLAVPAAIVAGVGGLLYYFEFLGDWADWYMWLLVPGFVGVGNILRGLLGEDTKESIGHGLNLMVVSAVLFLVFSAFFGGWNLLGDYGLSILLILLGLWVIGKGLYASMRRKREK